MVYRVVLNSRAMALILIPKLICAITVVFCSSFSTEGRPNRFPAAFARAIPECVRSSNKSRLNSATAEITYMVIFPAELVRLPPTPGNVPGCQTLHVVRQFFLYPIDIIA